MTGARRAAGVLLLALAGCTRGHASAAGEAHRVVSLGPATTEALFAVGAGDRVVARSRYCDWPPEATKLPAVGGVEPDVEAILQLSPDLVVGPSGQWSTPLTETMRAHGIATWFPPEIQSLEGVDALLVGIGEHTGHAEDARRITASIDAREAAIGAALANAPRPRVLFVVQLTPVVAAGPASFADAMLRRAAARNAVQDGGAWPVVGYERIAELDPDVVLDATLVENGGETHITPKAYGWSTVRAVREGHVVPLVDERVLRPGPRIAEGLAVLARALHPGATID
ncbi:MAG TPA: helical backbone metal receptor [Polyangiaceae bacterium]|jgi:iron complex transport system substrate-binding protein